MLQSLRCSFTTWCFTYSLIQAALTIPSSSLASTTKPPKPWSNKQNMAKTSRASKYASKVLAHALLLATDEVLLLDFEHLVSGLSDGALEQARMKSHRASATSSEKESKPWYLDHRSGGWSGPAQKVCRPLRRIKASIEPAVTTLDLPKTSFVSLQRAGRKGRRTRARQGDTTLS